MSKSLTYKSTYKSKLSAHWNSENDPQLTDFHNLNFFERRAKFAKWMSWIAMFWFGIDLITDLYIGGDILGPLAAISFMFYLFNKNKSSSFAQLPFRFNDEYIFLVKEQQLVKLKWEEIKPTPWKIGDLTIFLQLELYQEHPQLGKSFQIPSFDMEYGITMDDIRKVIELTKKGSP